MLDPMTRRDYVRAGSVVLGCDVSSRGVVIVQNNLRPAFIALVALTAPLSAQAQTGARSAASRPATTQSASAPSRTPQEEAELAIRLCNEGRPYEALELAR